MAVPYPEIRCITFVCYQFRSVYSQRHQQCAECITVPLANVLNSVRGACRYFDNVSIIWCRRAFARNACRMRRHATTNGHNNFINNSISSASERATSVRGSTVFWPRRLSVFVGVRSCENVGNQSARVPRSERVRFWRYIYLSECAARV